MEEKIKKILGEMNSNIVSYSGTSLLGDGIIDSFELIDIISRLEEELDMEIDAEYVTSENFANFKSIVALVKRMEGSI